MIIDDVHKVAFVHIPKCGGTSVRLQLAAIDSTCGRFYPVVDHPVLGKIHSSHIPLTFLRDQFLAEFEKIGRYQSFALIREPISRFASATYQRLKGHHRIPTSDITPALALQEAHLVIAWLATRETFCDFDYVHFARQRDFVSVGERQIVGNLFALEDMTAFAAAIGGASGVVIDPERRENSNFASSNPLFRSLRRTLRPVYRRLTSWHFRQSILLRLKSSSESAQPLYKLFHQDRTIRTFIETYYAGDFELYTDVRS